jgi:hypothetical protein
LESIPGLLKTLKIRALLFPQDERDTLTSGLGDSELIDSRLDSLSQQIVEKLIDKISSKGEY